MAFFRLLKEPPGVPGDARVPEAVVRAIMERLWSGAAAGDDKLVYAVLDGARDPRVEPAVRQCALPTQCLYSGKLHPSLAAAAPYLVQLARDAHFTRSLLSRSWGASWGVFVVSEAAPTDLARHLRRFLKVVDARGRRMVFRWYDPRVLRVYLPTCTDEELATLYGPATRLVAEDEDGRALLDFSRAEAGLATARTELAVGG